MTYRIVFFACQFQGGSMRSAFLLFLTAFSFTTQIWANVESSCQIHEKNFKKYKQCADGILSRLASCYGGENNWEKAGPLFQQLLEKPLYKKDINFLYAPTLHWLQNGGNEWIDFINAVTAIKPANLEALPRERLAEIWASVLNTPKVQSHASLVENALYQLYVELPETKAADQIAQEDVGKNWKLSRSQEDVLARARVLILRNQNNKVISTLQELSRTDISQKSASICEAHYMLGKALRNQRQYKDANKYLHQVIKYCEGDVKRDAFFVASRLAAMQPSDDSLSLFDRFLEEYPSHSYADDVLSWKITVLHEIKSSKEVNEAYVTFLDKYPAGDMAQNVTFRQAFFFAAQANFTRAVEMLKASMDNASKSLPDLRANYWYGRFLLYPSLVDWPENPDEGQKKEGLLALKLLSTEYPHTYYGYLAQRLVDGIVNGKSVPAKKIKQQKPAIVKNAEQLKPIIAKNINLEKDEDFRQATCLSDAGYQDEALIYLQKMFQEKTSTEDRITLAHLSHKLGRPDKGHQLMRQSGMSFPFAYDIRTQTLPWQLAFPKAYEKQITQAAQTAKMSTSLLFAIAREESAFDANAFSWAGARGLCQLMPDVAFAQAKKIKMKLASQDALFLPEINALLGADHFMEQLKNLGHPLLAIAAYNGGGGSVRKWLSKMPSEPFPVDVFVEQIPFEQTRDYVKKVSNAWMTYSWLDNGIDKIQFPLMLQKP